MNFINFIPEFKQVLTREGWLSIDDYWKSVKKSPMEVLVLHENTCKYACPNSFSQNFYQGVLIELITNRSRVILKPSNIVEGRKIKEFQIGDTFNNYLWYTNNKKFLTDKNSDLYMFQTIEKINRVLWEGNQYSLFFGKNVLLPIKFENDYILLPT